MPGGGCRNDRRARGSLLIVVASLEEIDAIVLHQVNDAMLGRQALAPHARPKVLQRLRFPDAGDGIAHDGIDDRESPGAVLGFVSTHHPRSARNSFWKTEIRPFLPAALSDGLEAELRAELLHGPGLSVTSECASESRQHTCRVLRGAQEMRGLEQALQLGGRDERHVLVTATIDDHDVPPCLEPRRAGEPGSRGRRSRWPDAAFASLSYVQKYCTTVRVPVKPAKTS